MLRLLLELGCKALKARRALMGVLVVCWGLLVAGHSVGGQVVLRGELGWQRMAVPGAVNPLAVTVENKTGKVLAGTVVGRGETGWGWRGQSVHVVRFGVLLAPGGTGRYVVPWPLEAGPTRLVLSLESEGQILAQWEVPVQRVPGKMVAWIGVVPDVESAELAVALSPEDLPEDPLFLTCFSQVVIGPGVAVSAAARAALEAWTAFLGGEVVGIPMPQAGTPVSFQELKALGAAHPPRRPPAGFLVLGAVIYVVLVAYVFSSWARGERSWAFAGLWATALFLSLFYPVLYGTPDRLIFVKISLCRADVSRFSFVLSAVRSLAEVTWALPGLWVERAVEQVERVVEWVWTPQGPVTRIGLEPGQTRYLWRLDAPWTGPGQTTEFWMGSWADLSVPVRTVLGMLRNVLQPGDRLVLRQELERERQTTTYRYFAFWEPTP